MSVVRSPAAGFNRGRVGPWLLLTSALALLGVILAGVSPAEGAGEPILSLYSSRTSIDDAPQSVVVSQTGRFAPARQPPGEARVLLVDDDMERWLSGPWLEAYIVTALNDGGYSFDVFRAGNWAGVNREFPGGEEGLSVMDDYEVVIWYSGWNTEILTDDEVSVIEAYLDGQNGGQDNFHTTNRNIIHILQMPDWLQSSHPDYYRNYLHAQTRSGASGTMNPLEGVEGSAFDGMSFSTGWAGKHTLERPFENRPNDSTSQGLLYIDPEEEDEYRYHAIQYPETASGFPHSTTYRSILFSEDFAIFDVRSERAAFFSALFDWMGVDPTSQKAIDMGIGELWLPNHARYWRAIEANVPLQIKTTLTNYGSQARDHTAVRLTFKNEFGRELFNLTYDSRAFEVGSLDPGESWEVTFSSANNRWQFAWEGAEREAAPALLFPIAGMNRVVVEVLQAGDQMEVNNYLLTQMGVAEWVENAELPENELGELVTFEDTAYHGNQSLNHTNVHRVHDYDWDSNPSTANESSRSTVHEGDYSFAYFNKNGWRKSNGEVVFTPEPYQDDALVSPLFDLSGFEEAVLRCLYTGKMDDGETWRIQVKKAAQNNWTTIFSLSDFAPSKGSWYICSGDNPKYQGLEIPSAFIGDEDSQIQIRFQYLADGDQNSDCGGSPCLGLLFEGLALMGTERLIHDVAVTDLSVRSEGFRVHEQTGPNDRELNLTLTNLAQAAWAELPVEVMVTDAQGQVVFAANLTLPGTLKGHGLYGDLEAPGHENDTALFWRLEDLAPGSYTVTATARTDEGLDLAMANNTLTGQFWVNGPPLVTIESISPSPAVEAEPVSFDGAAVDLEGEVTAYKWLSSLEGFLSSQRTFASDSLIPGDHTIYFRARDDEGAWSEPATASLHVNGRPVALIELLSPTAINAGEVVSLEGSGSDKDGRVVAYQWRSDREGVLSQLPGFQTGDLSAGDHTLSFRVQDDEGAWSEPATASLHVNGRPTATIVALTPTAAIEGETVTFEGWAWDAEGAIAAYQWVSDLEGSIGDELSFATDTLGAGDHRITFRVQDMNGVWSEEVSRTLHVNGRPTVTLVNEGPLVVIAGKKLTLQGIGSDADGRVTAFNWRVGEQTWQTNSPYLTLAGPGAAGADLQLEAGVYQVGLMVRDDEGAWSEELTASLEVLPNETGDRSGKGLLAGPEPLTILLAVVVLAALCRTRPPPTGRGR